MSAREATPLRALPTTDRLLNAAEIAAEKFSGKKSPRWVKAHVPGRIAGSREALWFESAVDAYLNELRRSA